MMKRFAVYGMTASGRIGYALDFNDIKYAVLYCADLAGEVAHTGIVDRHLAQDDTDRIVWRSDGAPADWGTFDDSGLHKFIPRA